MRHILILIAALVPAIAWSQDSRTDCVNTPPVSSCTTTSTTPRQQVTAPDVMGAFQRGAQQAQREQAQRQEAELAAEQLRTMQLQNQLLQQQIEQRKQIVSAEAAVIRQAFAAFLEEQWKLPQEQRMQDQTEIAQKIGAIAHSMLGHEPSAEAFALAANQLQAIPPR